MSAARSNLLIRLESYRNAVSATSLVDKSIGGASSSLTEAVLLRNGMAVVGFTMLEDFMKARADEVTKSVKNNGRAFSDLPKKLQHAATSLALKGVLARARFIEDEGADGIAFIQTAAQAVSSTLGRNYKLSAYSLPSDRTNLSADLIKDFLGAFAVRDPWGQMDKLSSRIGFGLPSTRDIFVAAAKRRHSAAHSASAQIPLGDLQQFADQALTIAIAFDVLVTLAARSVFSSLYVPGDEKYCVDAASVRLLFVDQTKSGHWHITSEGKRRTLFKSPSFDQTRQKAAYLAKRNKEPAIFRDISRKPVGWVVN